MARVTYYVYLAIILVVGYLFGLIGALVLIAVGVAVAYLIRRRAPPRAPSILAKNLFRTGDLALDDYLSGVGSRLANEGFRVETDVMVGQQKALLYSTQSRFELSKLGNVKRVVAVFVDNAVSRESMMRLVDAVVTFSIKPSLIDEMANQSNLLFVVTASPIVDDDMKTWIEDYVGKRGMRAASLPVLVSLSERKVYHSLKSPAIGRAYYGGLRKFADNNLGFWSLPPSQQ